MNCKDYLINRLKSYTKEDIIFTTHASIRMIQRQISEEEVIENILKPVRLYYAIEESVNKFDCFFDFSKNLCHRYVIVINHKILIVIALKINRKWQYYLEKRIRHD